MEKYKGKSARCIDFPTSQGHGAYGALWNSVSEEHKTKWKQDIPELLTMSAWKDDPSQLEIVNDRRLIKFDDLMRQTNKLSKFRLSELVACIAIWLHWYDEGVSGLCAHVHYPPHQGTPACTFVCVCVYT